MNEFSEDPLAFLVHPESKSTFLRDAWEKKAALYSAKKDAPRSQLKDVLDMKHLCSILDDKEEEGHCLCFGIDCCAMAYIDGERSDLGGTMGELLDSKQAQNLYSVGATLQVHQPQRFSTMLWKLCAALETQLGCLVGCNAYITPADAQGLAPHWDDVSIFVLQTAGSKSWKVYGPMKDCELPSASSGDIDRSALPAPALEVTLKVGDVLFIPRGHIHEASAHSEGSAHVTVSAYQQWTWMQMAMSVLKACNEGREPCPEAPLDLRSGLPIGFVFSQSLSSEALITSIETEKASAATDPQQPLNSTAASKDAAGNLAGALRKMADAIEENPQATNTAAQAKGLEFMRSRLPPHPDQLPASGKPPTLNSLVCCRKPGAFLLTSDDAREWMRSDQHPGLNSDSEEEEDYSQEMDADMMGAEEFSEEDADMSDSEEQDKKTEKQSTCGVSPDVIATAKEGQKNGKTTKGQDETKAGKSGLEKGGHAAGKGLVELDRTAGEGSDEEEGDSEGDEGSDIAIDDDVLGAELEEYMCLATCLHNDRRMHMIDPRLAAATAVGMDVSGGVAASMDEDESEGDDPPDLVAINAQPGASHKACDAAVPEIKKPSGAPLAGAKASDCCVQGLCQAAKVDEDGVPWMLDIPVRQGLAVAKILESVNGQSLRVSSLPLEDDLEKMQLVLALHEWGALCTLPDEKKQIKKSKQGPKVASQGTKKKIAAGKQKLSDAPQKGFCHVVSDEKKPGASKKKNKKKKGKVTAQ